jgi:hypothetical protein
MKSTSGVSVDGSAGVVLGSFDRVAYDIPPRSPEALLETARGTVRVKLNWLYDDITSISVAAADEVAVREALKLRSCTLKPVTTA